MGAKRWNAIRYCSKSCGAFARHAGAPQATCRKPSDIHVRIAAALKLTVRQVVNAERSGLAKLRESGLLHQLWKECA